MDNIEPWCISRQLWWGHQIPAWYGPDGEIFVDETEVLVSMTDGWTAEEHARVRGRFISVAQFGKSIVPRFEQV